MATTLPDYELLTGWQDLAALGAYGAISGATCIIQNKSLNGAGVEVYFSASPIAPVDTSGELLGHLREAHGTAAHVWVRSDDPGAVVGVSLADVPSAPPVAITAMPPVVLASQAAAVVLAGVAINATTFATLRVQIDGLAGGDTVGFAASLAAGGATYLPRVTDVNGNSYASVGAPGIYIVDARAFITITRTGAASTPLFTAMAHQ